MTADDGSREREQRRWRRARPHGVRWFDRVAAVSLGTALLSASLASQAPGLAHAQSAGASRSRSSAPAAAGSDAVRHADAAFREGRAFFDLGRYREACEKFELSMALDPSPGTSLNLGNCYEPQGDLVRALENFERAFTGALQTSDTRRKELWTEAARERIANLSRRVPTLRLRNVPVDARVSLDDRLLEHGDESLRLNPGRHRVEVSAPGKVAFRQDLELAVGQRLTIDVPALQADPLSPEEELAEEARDSAAREGTGGGYGPWPYVLGGAGVLFLATAVGTGLAANAKENELENECFGTECPLRLEGTRDSAKTLALFTDIFWITGLLSAGVGVTLFVLDGQDDTPGTSFEASCFGSGCGLVASGRF